MIQRIAMSLKGVAAPWLRRAILGHNGRSFFTSSMSNTPKRYSNSMDSVTSLSGDLFSLRARGVGFDRLFGNQSPSFMFSWEGEMQRNLQWNMPGQENESMKVNAEEHSAMVEKVAGSDIVRNLSIRTNQTPNIYKVNYMKHPPQRSFWFYKPNEPKRDPVMAINGAVKKFSSHIDQHDTMNKISEKPSPFISDSAMEENQRIQYPRRQKQHAAALMALSLTFLTVGISLGMWWAYHELGWGGYWFWDPVENLSLMPWLTAVCALHVFYVNTAGAFYWQFFLCFATFFLSVFGLWFVRSGLLTSIHSFASSPKGTNTIWLVIFITLIANYFYVLLPLIAIKKRRPIPYLSLAKPRYPRGKK